MKLLDGFWCAIHSNRIHVTSNDFICFVEEGLICLYNGHKTGGIWHHIFQRAQSSIIAIGPGGMCLVKIYVIKKRFFYLKWHGTKTACHKIVMFHWVVLRDIAFRVIPNIAWFTPYFVAWWELELMLLYLVEGHFLENDIRKTMYGYISQMMIMQCDENKFRIVKFIIDFLSGTAQYIKHHRDYFCNTWQRVNNVLTAWRNEGPCIKCPAHYLHVRR